MVRGDTAALIRSFVETGIKLSKRGFSTGVTASMKSVITGKVAHIGGFASIAVLLPLVNYMLVTNAIEIDASRKTFWNGGKVVGQHCSHDKELRGLKLFKAGSRVGVTAASEGGAALFWGLSTAGRVAHIIISGFVLSAVL